MRIFGVLATVQLNNQCSFAADKVSDVRADGELANELQAFALAAAQLWPKVPFRVADVAAQGPGPGY